MNFLSKLIDICISFAKIGFFSFGGGNSMLKMIEFEAVANRSWITSQEFSQLTGATFLFPGLTAVKLSTLIGYKVGGVLGAFFAFVCVNVPGVILTLVGLTLLRSYEGHPKYAKLVTIVQYGALAVLLAAVYSVAEPIIKTQFSLVYLLGAIVFMLTMIIFDVSPFLGLIIYIGLFFFIPFK